MPKRVLIVDDSPSLRKMVFLLFTSNGFSICGEAENGAQAIEKARQTRPDIIVLDYSMPVMDGIRAAQSLKQLMPRVPHNQHRVIAVLNSLKGTGNIVCPHRTVAQSR
jgi:CheY-like chemotaxis protein